MIKGLSGPLRGIVSPFGISALNFSPASLFIFGEQGAWYEPGPSACFTDTAGTIPAAVGDSVARINDLSSNGNHATQATAAARPIFAREPATGRRNLALPSEPAVAGLSVAVGSPADAAGFGGFSHSIQFSAAAVTQVAYIASDTTDGLTATLSVFVTMDDGLAPAFGSASASNAANDFALNLRNNVIDPTTYIVSDLGGGVYRVSATGTTGSNLSNMGVAKYSSGSGRGFRVAGYQIEYAASVSAYQKSVSVFDVTEAGVADTYALVADGVDDFMTTPAMDFTASAQAHMVAAFRTDTPISINSPVMLFGGDLINGSLWFNTGSGSIDTLQGQLRGTASVLSNPRVNITSPQSLVVSHKGDLAAPQANQIEFRVDGVAETGAVNADASGTTFGNHALTLFENPRTSAHFFGRFYGGLILNRALTTDELAQTETYHAEKVGVTLP